IHALTRSATCMVVNQQAHHQNFNPRTHEECDQINVTTHKRINNFNPRTHEECDLAYVEWILKNWTFQSTHSRGVRQIGGCRSWKDSIFQSTHSRGVRHLNTSSVLSFLVFQSTHSRGVRRHNS